MILAIQRLLELLGADLILLNCVDVLNPEIFGLDVKEGSFVDELHRLVGPSNRGKLRASRFRSRHGRRYFYYQ
ncbi:DUF7916 family protein [Clostridium chauvoei]|uniref:DUF7916 family protein n=1 Tax=Clostridium chauvoei TaxID=46867 RepID=UPI0024B9AE48|nr:hypothetical protein [Clostridium chauvoei]